MPTLTSPAISVLDRWWRDWQPLIKEVNMELHTPAEVATILKVSEDTVIRRFGDMPGVIDLGSPELVGRRTGRKRRYRVLRIPTTVLNRFLFERGAE